MIQRVPDDWNVHQNDALNDVQLDANTIVYNLPALIQTSELQWTQGGVPNPIDLHGDGRGRGRADGNPSPPQMAVGGTLQSVVNQSATIQPLPPPAASKSGRRRHVPWSRRAARASSDSSSLQAVPVAVDALVPCNNSTNKGGPGSYGTWSTTQGGSCSAAAEKGYPRGSMTTFETESRQLTAETGELEMISNGFTFTSNSIGSLGNTSSAANQTTNNDSASHSINEGDGEEDKSKIKGKTSQQVSMKKNRAAAVHNQSERKRRDRINEKMKTLQRMVPNASKTDKASMLDEVIDYLKQLQAQINLMTRMPSIMMQQQLQLMSMMGMGMNMGLAGMGITGAGGPMVPPPNMAAGNVLPPYMNPFMSPTGWEGIIGHGSDVPMQIVPTGLEAPVPNPFNMFLARQQAEAPDAMESAARMTAMYQQFQQVHGA